MPSRQTFCIKTLHENDPIFFPKGLFYIYQTTSRIFSSCGCAITVPYRIMPVIEVLCLHMLCDCHMVQQGDTCSWWKILSGGLCLYTHSVAECWLCLATSNVCSFVGAPPVCVSIDCMYVCIMYWTHGHLVIWLTFRPFLYTHVVLIEFDWSAYKG